MLPPPLWNRTFAAQAYHPAAWPMRPPTQWGLYRHIPDKIRQQLQVLRDLGLLEFLGSGSYCLK